MVDQSSNETIIKGDTLIAEVVMIATNDLFDIVIHSKMILGDGTFKICPKLWTQVFIIRRLLHSMHLHFLARQVQNII